MVVGVEDARRQLDQLPLVTEEQQAAHARLGRRHQHRADPVAGLEQKLRGESEPGRQIEAVLPDHQHEIALEIGRAGVLAQGRQGGLQLVRRGAGLHGGAGADQGQALHHPEGGIAGALRQGPAGRQHHP